MARALWQIQSLYGLIPAIYGLGARANALEARLRQLFADAGEPSASADRPISHALLVERSLDLPSALLTGMTYEAMLNDTFDYSCGKIVFGDQVERKLKNHNAKTQRAFPLNNSDVIFSAIRNTHITGK